MQFTSPILLRDITVRIFNDTEALSGRVIRAGEHAEDYIANLDKGRKLVSIEASDNTVIVVVTN